MILSPRSISSIRRWGKEGEKGVPNLDVTMWVLGGYERDGMLRSQGETCAGGETLVPPDDGLELDDAFDRCFLAVQTVDDQVDIARVRGSPWPVVSSLRSTVGGRSVGLTQSTLREGRLPRDLYGAGRRFSLKAGAGGRMILRRRCWTSLRGVSSWKCNLPRTSIPIPDRTPVAMVSTVPSTRQHGLQLH